MKILFACVNYKSEKITNNYIENVANLEGYNSKNIDIIIVDNSQDFNYTGSVDIEVIKCENEGYFKGLNRAIEYTKEKRYNFVIIGNNDLSFSKNFLQELHNVDSNKYIISPMIITIDGHHQNPHVINDLSKLRLFYLNLIYSSYYLFRYLPNLVKFLVPNSIRRKDELQFSRSMWISQGHGSCYVLTAKYLEIFKYLPELTFLYGEEFFLQHQLKEKNLKIFYNPRLRLTHLEHSTTSRMRKKAVYINQKKAFKLESEIRKLNKTKYGYSSLF